MMGLLLVAFILMSAMISAAIGRWRFYLQCTQSGREFRRAHYGAWVEKSFAALSAVGFSPLAFVLLAEVIAWIADDYTEGPLFFSVILVAILAVCYYQFILEVARHFENDYRYRTVQEFTVPCRLRGGKKMVDAEELLTAIERARRKMSRYVVLGPDVELDIIDPAIPAEMKRIRRRTSSRRSEIEASRSHRGWGIVRPVGRRMIIGNLALDSEKVFASEAEPETKTLPIINLKPTPEEFLEQQLTALPSEDRELVEQLFSEEPVIRRLVLAPDYLVRLSIVPETESAPRHVRIRGIILH